LRPGKKINKEDSFLWFRISGVIILNRSLASGQTLAG
jgi:hypothetical protein